MGWVRRWIWRDGMVEGREREREKDPRRMVVRRGRISNIRG